MINRSKQKAPFKRGFVITQLWYVYLDITSLGHISIPMKKYPCLTACLTYHICTGNCSFAYDPVYHRILCVRASPPGMACESRDSRHMQCIDTASPVFVAQLCRCIRSIFLKVFETSKIVGIATSNPNLLFVVLKHNKQQVGIWCRLVEFTDILQDYFTGIDGILWLPQCPCAQ